MTEDHIEEHLNRRDRTFNFHDKVTYIEKQEITVQSGANFYNGPQSEKIPAPDRVYPPENDYKQTVVWLQQQKTQGVDWIEICNWHWPTIAKRLSGMFGWDLDPHSLNAAYNRAQKNQK